MYVKYGVQLEWSMWNTSWYNESASKQTYGEDKQTQLYLNK